MNKSIRTSVIWILAAFSLVSLSACNRLNSVPGSVSTLSQQKTLYLDITTSSNWVEAGSSITLNVVVYQQSGSDGLLTLVTGNAIDAADLSWTSTSGQFVSNKGYQVSFIAPSASGNVSVYAGLINGSKYAELGDLDIPGHVTVNVVSTLTPAAPQGLSAVASDNTVTLSWRPNTEKFLGGYYVYYQANNGSESDVLFSDRVTVNAGSTSVTLTKLTNNSRYYFAVVAYSNNSIVRESAPSNKASAIPTDTTAPHTPTEFNVAQISGDTKMNLSWKNPTDADFRGVRVIRRTAPGDPISPLEGVLVYEGRNTQFVDETGIELGKLYTYTIYAFDDEQTRNYSDPVSVYKIPIAQGTSH